MLSALPGSELLENVRAAAGHERNATARLVALIAEVDSRRLYLGEGFSSMFAFCTRSLHMSEQTAYARIEAARVARRFPVVLEMLSDGRLSLTTIGLLAPHLTDETADALFDAAQHRTKRDVERLIAALHPQPDIPATIRAAPLAPAEAVAMTAEVSPPALLSSEPSRPAIAPLAPRRYFLRVTIGEETQRLFEQARALLRHEIPDGDPAAIIDRALKLLVADAERTKFAATGRPSGARGTKSADPKSRRIPAAVRRAVWKRDHGQCAFNGRDGRCGESGFLEFHHVTPFALGGPSTIENLELRCRAHNQYEAEIAGVAM